MKSSKTGKNRPESSQSIIGNNLTAIRQSKGLTRAYVAYHTCISNSTLYRLETGRCGKVGVWALFDVAEFYKIEPHTLLRQEMYYKSPK